ncbi:MAG: hypothetical protein HN764_06290 [Gammaproteobacteria bacterium]|jgi:predicted MFS family arabinose efflux permease|nr:hypothetical protein [Gammaproteobacteria bacterium]
MSSDTKAAIGILATWCIGFSGVAVEPLWISIVVSEAGLSDAVAGRIDALQVGCVGIASLFIAPRMAKVDRRILAYFGIVLLIFAYFISAIYPGFVLFIVSRAIAGIAEGILLSVSHAAVAATRKPDQLFSIAFLMLILYGILVYRFVPPLAASHGLFGVFGIVVIIAIVGAPLIWLLPRTVPDTIKTEGVGIVPLNITAICALLATCLFYLAQGGLWAYLMRIGEGVGLSKVEVGNFISYSLIFAMAGAITAFTLRDRIGHQLPVCVGLFLLCGAALMLGTANNGNTFFIAAALQQTVGFFVMIYFASLLASLDPLGRIVAASIAFRSLGSTSGPAVVGYTVTGNDYTMAGWATFSAYALSLILMLIALSYTRKNSQAGSYKP